MKVIDVHAHAIFKETLNSIKELGPEIGGDQDNPWFRAGDYKLEGVRYENTPFMDINLRLEAMDSLGIDYQVISPNPITYFHFIEPKEAINYCKLHNDTDTPCNSSRVCDYMGSCSTEVITTRSS